MGALVMMSWRGKHRSKRGPLARDDISIMRAPTHGVRARQVEVSSSIDENFKVPSYSLLFSEPLHVTRDSWPLASTVSPYSRIQISV